MESSQAQRLRETVYVVGAGFSGRLGDPLTKSMLIDVWNRLKPDQRHGLLRRACLLTCPGTGRALFVSYRNTAQSVPGTIRIEGSDRRLSVHWTHPPYIFKSAAGAFGVISTHGEAYRILQGRLFVTVLTRA